MRRCGILMPIFSLPSKYGIGSFSKEAYEFVDFLKAAGQSLWQILPLGPTGYGDSPYQSFSTFAGNPYFIDVDEFVEAGFITEADCKKFACKDTGYVDYEDMYKKRFKLLRKAFENSNVKALKAYKTYAESMGKIEHDETGGLKPQVLAQKISKIIRKKNPRHGYVVASFEQRLSVFLKRILPAKWFALILASYYKL